MYDIIIFTCVSDFVPSRGIGAYRVANSLRNRGYSVQVIDFTDWFSVDELIEISTKCIGSNTKIIGVSSTFYQKKHNSINTKNNTTEWLQTEVGIPDNVIDTLKFLKKIHPHIKYIVGGANSFLYENDLLFDAVFHSYSDEAIIEYVDSKRIWKKHLGRDIVEGENTVIEVDKLTNPWTINDHILPGESLPIEISRGCIFKCKFCNFQLTGKKKIDYLRNIDCLKKEFLENYEKFGTTNYMFTDDTFNDSTEKLKIINDCISSLPFKINFTTYLRLDLLHAHPEQIELLKNMGLKSAFFGIESFNEKTLRTIGKGLSPEKIKDTLLKIKHDYFPEDFSMLCSFIVGLPFDSLESIEESFQWTLSNDINTIWMPLFIRTDARYKSDIDINYEKYGYRIPKKNEWENDYTNFFEAIKIASRYQSQTNNTRSTWPLFAMASLGKWNLNDLIKMRIKDIDTAEVGRQRDIFISKYKTSLFQNLKLTKK
jgi:radical SAM superfamily enzyme